MRRLAHHAVVTGVIAVASACATTRNVGVEPTNVITATQLSGMSSASAYQVIQRLRPQFLRTRGPTTILNHAEHEIGVYVDNMLLGGVSELRHLPASELLEIRYLSATDAATRYGGEHPSGVIAIKTLR